MSAQADWSLSQPSRNFFLPPLTFILCTPTQVAAGRAERRGTRGLDSPETPDRPELRSATAAAARAPAAQAAALNGDDEAEAAGSSGAVPSRSLRRSRLHVFLVRTAETLVSCCERPAYSVYCCTLPTPYGSIRVHQAAGLYEPCLQLQPLSGYRLLMMVQAPGKSALLLGCTNVCKRPIVSHAAGAGEPNGEMSYPASLASRAASNESGGGGGNDATEADDDVEDEEGSPVAVAATAPARAAITAMADVSHRPGASSLLSGVTWSVSLHRIGSGRRVTCQCLQRAWLPTACHAPSVPDI